MKIKNHFNTLWIEHIDIVYYLALKSKLFSVKNSNYIQSINLILYNLTFYRFRYFMMFFSGFKSDKNQWNFINKSVGIYDLKKRDKQLGTYKFKKLYDYI